MFRPLLLIAATTLSLSSHAGLFDFLTPKNEALPNPQFNTVICYEDNNGGPVATKEVRVELSRVTSLRGQMQTNQYIPGKLTVLTSEGSVFEKEMTFTRHGGGARADELTANPSGPNGHYEVKVNLSAPEKVDYESERYSRETDLTGGIDINTEEINIWLDHLAEPNPLRCKVSLEAR